MINVTGWALFWVFSILYLLIETYLFTSGYDTFLWKHKTVEEKQIQQIKIQQMKNAASTNNTK